MDPTQAVTVTASLQVFKFPILSFPTPCPTHFTSISAQQREPLKTQVRYSPISAQNPPVDPTVPFMDQGWGGGCYKSKHSLPIWPHFLLLPSLPSSTCLATLTFIFFKKWQAAGNARHSPALGPLHWLFFLFGMFFPPVSTWLALSLHASFCSCATFSVNLSLTNLFKIAITSHSHWHSLSFFPWFFFSMALIKLKLVIYYTYLADYFLSSSLEYYSMGTRMSVYFTAVSSDSRTVPGT